MSYRISVSHLEKETVVSVEIFSASEESRSARISQFQCIGWLLGIFDYAQRLVDGSDGLLNTGYDQEALERVARLLPDQASRLLALTTLKDRFEYVWDVIGESERELARVMDFRYYDNFWPDFDSYSILWNPTPTPYPGQNLPLPDALYHIENQAQITGGSTVSILSAADERRGL
ncbi:hypothetical protein AEQ67_18870 [Pseudomonas sp. RIT-PI-q]|uniref:hypothetical protein n=1 Tax=Pseudomonas sp. RIT-PI-q TaxID=1690247 RepID=UPI0006CC5A14|nr:hypothetical protein [Pseudomonas sp. RIT-PI-q]KPG95996.1 hypothetical protein AEQ67_18870 [Pseudomonas sp. RIT-PI-q]